MNGNSEMFSPACGFAGTDLCGKSVALQKDF
jgi:hypothetical protein